MLSRLNLHETSSSFFCHKQDCLFQVVKMLIDITTFLPNQTLLLQTHILRILSCEVCLLILLKGKSHFQLWTMVRKNMSLPQSTTGAKKSANFFAKQTLAKWEYSPSFFPHKIFCSSPCHIGIGYWCSKKGKTIIGIESAFV